MNVHDNEYALAVDAILSGQIRPCRQGVFTRSAFGLTSKYTLGPATFVKSSRGLVLRVEGFPLLTSKRVPFASIVKELLWFLRGETNTATLGCGIWDKWASPDGDLGPIYGRQWRSWGAADGTSVDQIINLIKGIAADPFGRRHIVNAWNVADIGKMALPPCHLLFQCHVSSTPSGYPSELHMTMYQRSADFAVGVPFNIASYALLLCMIAVETGLKPGTLTHMVGDAHVYESHIPGLTEQMKRQAPEPPILEMNVAPIFTRKLDDIRLDHYDPCPAIPFEVY